MTDGTLELMGELERALPQLAAAALEEAARNSKSTGLRNDFTKIELYKSFDETLSYMKRRADGAATSGGDRARRRRIAPSEVQALYAELWDFRTKLWDQLEETYSDDPMVRLARKLSDEIIRRRGIYRQLVLSDDATEIQRLEAAAGCTQDEAGRHLIEDLCLADEMPEFDACQGSPHERREALRALWRADAKEE